MSHADATADLPPPPDPTQDRRTRPVPPNIADILALLHILLVYGRHLALTLDRRAAAGRFSIIAQFFGTARLPVLRARLTRGLLRVQALQRVLLARARRGRDLVFLKPVVRASRKPKPAVPPAADPQAEAPPPPPARVRRADPDAAPDLDHLPTLAQLEVEIRRRGIGRAIADICRDFGVSPSLCERRFFSALFDVLTLYRGNVPRLMKDLRRRAVAYEPEWDRDFRLGKPERTTESIQCVLGFLLGERWPVVPNPLPAPFRLPAMATTGPS